MKGDYLHNQLLVGRLATDLREAGCVCSVEHRVDPTPHPRHADLAAIIQGRFVVFEVERSAVRVASDIAKARTLGADVLNVVVPHPRLVRAIRRRLGRCSGCFRQSPPEINVLTLGAARRWIAQQVTVVPGLTPSPAASLSNRSTPKARS